MSLEQGLLAAIGALTSAIVYLYLEQRAEYRNCREQIGHLWNHIVTLTQHITAMTIRYGGAEGLPPMPELPEALRRPRRR